MIPADIREKLGIRPGPVDITIDGAGIRIDLPSDGELEEEDGLLIIKATGTLVTDDEIRALRLADQA